MAQVIIVSNRLPLSVKKENGQLNFYPSVGGLATGLASYVKGRNNLWIGWPGLPSDDLTETEKQAISHELAKHNCAPVFLTQRQLDDFYSGFSNTLLWPLFHNLRVPESPLYARWWRSYKAVNKLFAEAVLALAHQDSTIWVHDYQLMLAPQLIRKEAASSHIGLFMHIPFPDYRTLSKLPAAKDLLKGMIGADLIGFHTQDYVNKFLETCGRLSAFAVEDQQIRLKQRLVRVTDFPMGIDYEKFASAGKSRAVKIAVKKFKKRYAGYKLIAAVDRLDPSKGLIERLNAYREFLEQNPKQQGKVILSMVVAPSRSDVPAYINLKKRLDKLVIEINQQFSTARWQPIDYINGLPFEEVTALFRVADVAFIAPLRDGMNLVAKEFIASKDRSGGVLILSQTTGAAEELKEALLVDPKQQATVVAALQQALTMPKRELRQRLKKMQTYLAHNTVHTWANNFMSALDQPLPAPRRFRTATLNDRRISELLTAYQVARKRLLLLDYDGTLIPLAANFDDAAPGVSLIDLLKKLCQDPANEVVLISGRKRQELEEWIGSPEINLVAEHGAYMRRSRHVNWEHEGHTSTEWKKAIIPILERYASLTPNAQVEEKGHSVVWHYRQSPPYYAHKYAVIIRRTLQPLIKKYGLAIFSGSKILEIRDPHLNKGEAIKAWLIKDHDFVLALGDDYTDEDMFSVLPVGSYGLKVGPGRTQATFRVNSYHEVRRLLQNLAA